jgi:hypothetical protein
MKPTEPGYYWYRTNRNQKMVLEVYFDEYSQNLRSHLFLCGTEYVSSIDSPSCNDENWGPRVEEWIP